MFECSKPHRIDLKGFKFDVTRVQAIMNISLMFCFMLSGGGGVSSLSMHATAGSDLEDNFDNLSHDPLQPTVTSERGLTSASVETFLPSR